MEIPVILLAIIAGILFYRFVERRHKIALGKVLLALLALGFLIAGATALYYHRAERAKQRLVDQAEVTFVPVGADTAAVFEICNSRHIALHRVEFLASGYQQGRSTPHPLRPPRTMPPLERNDGTVFSTDYIVPPYQCATVTWRGTYRRFSAVGTRVLSIRYGDGSQVGFFRGR